jgi:twitching motility two-component system response regulator PilH
MPIQKVLIVDDSKTETMFLSELLRKNGINRTPEYSQIPIFICTSKNLETDRVWGMRQGARDYITKPVDGAQLLSKIKALG